jgi:hypothetical protein
MIERVADKILAMIDDVRWSHHDIDYLAWQLVQKSNRPMLRRLVDLSVAIIQHNDNMIKDEDDNTLW